MAQMLPDQVLEHTSSNAEKRLFGKLREELSGEWTVLHSLGIASHATKPWAEVDFVLVGPPGVICLEVKGGRVRREDGYWLFIDGTDNVHRKRQGPFDQVGSASAALYNWLKANCEGFGSSFVGYAVATPDAPWKIEGPDLMRELVYDSELDAIGPEAFVNQVADYWGTLTKDRFGRTPAPLDAPARKRVIDAIRGDFDLRPSLRARVRNINDDLLRLTRSNARRSGTLHL